MENTDYSIVQPPVKTLRFDEMSKRDLKEYNRWFHEVMPQRIAELAQAVRKSPGFEHWRPDYTPKSLDALGRWLATQVETRPRTEEELREAAERLPHPEWEPDRALTDRTVSLAYDVGMYMSQVLLRNHPSLRWDQLFGSKRFIDYGRPVLMGFINKVPFSPVHMITTFEYALISGKKSGNGLRQMYDIWSGMISQKPESAGFSL